MIRLNAEAERTHDYSRAAAQYFGNDEAFQRAALLPKIARWTARHLELAGISLLLSILVGVPLGIVASRGGGMGQAILAITSAVQTIPSLALLALLVPVPFFGISARTAIAALFLYGLLPIVRNTATGLQDIAQPLRESAIALGLSKMAQLRQIHLPLASRTILAGIKTSAIINIGTATLAALIGAGGLGEPIISGLNLNDHATILQGAIPAAVLALLVQWSFESTRSRPDPERAAARIKGVHTLTDLRLAATSSVNARTRRVQSVGQLIRFHQGHARRVILPAHDRGVIAGHERRDDRAFQIVCRRDAARLDLRGLALSPVVVESH